MERTDIKKVFETNDKGLLKYFKYYCKQAKHELDVDALFRLENLHFKQYNLFGYQTKIIPTFISAEDMASTFRNIVKYFKERKTQDSELRAGVDAGKSAFYIDFNLFKRALVRIALMSFQQDDS